MMFGMSLKRALIAAVFCHVLGLSAFIFTFKTHSVMPSPMFVFLGSILTRRDLYQSSLEKTIPPQQLGTLDLGHARSKDNDDLSSDTVILKPAYSHVMNQYEKMPLKSTVIERIPMGSDNAAKTGEDIGVAVNIPPHIPLRLPSR